jgi:hypothetical protein
MFFLTFSLRTVKDDSFFVPQTIAMRDLHYFLHPYRQGPPYLVQANRGRGMPSGKGFRPAFWGPF